jgi:hypothetical protein
MLAGCGGGQPTPRAVTPPKFPSGTPRWLAENVTHGARGLGDPSARVVSVKLGRFPTVVVRGQFVCETCSRPPGASAPRGEWATMRYDALTHEDVAFSLGGKPAAVSPDLCSGPCNRSADVLESAFAALQRHSPGEPPFDNRVGRSHCHIRLPVHEYRWIWGRCSVAMTLGRRPVVTFRESWNGLDRNGRRYSPQAPRRHHVWVVTESSRAFVTSVRSSGERPPQERRR